MYENTTDVSSYSYDAAKKELVSYDTPDIVRLKAQYVNATKLAGSMFWDVSIEAPSYGLDLTIWQISTDKAGSLSLVNVSATTYASLDRTQVSALLPTMDEWLVYLRRL